MDPEKLIAEAKREEMPEGRPWAHGKMVLMPTIDEEPAVWPLSEQAVALEEIPTPLAKVLEAHGVQTWADVDEMFNNGPARLLLYPGVGRKLFHWLKYELARRSGATKWRSTGQVQIPRFARLKVANMPPDRAGVYFIQCGPFVKIGLAQSVRKRFQGLQQVMPFQLELRGVIQPAEGQKLRDLERGFHKRFKSAHQVGEWFRLEGELDAFCLKLARGEAVE